MFFFTYLAKELRRRLRQAIFIALGLAVGVGLVLTVKAASAGVTNAQSAVLQELYGVGTDITVTGAAPKPPSGTTTGPGPGGGNSTQITMGPNGAEECTNGKCHSLKTGYTINNLANISYSPISASDVAKIAALHSVLAAVGGLSLTDNQITISSTGGSPPTSFTVFGTDVTALKLGPISDAVLSDGRTFTASDADRDVAVVDKDYATANDLKVGKTIKVGGVRFTIIGLVSQPQGSAPPNVYIPLARAQALATGGLTNGGTLKGDVNTIYATAASAADIATVQSEIARVVPTATITTPSSLAKEITGSVSSAAKLAGDLGTWLSILVLLAAFAVAVLLTMSAVSRRVREFGTLKALGWRGRRIVAQVMGEAIAVGVAGAALGVGIGYAGAAIINAVAPRLSGTLPSQSNGQQIVQSANGVAHAVGPAAAQTVPVSVPLIASVSGGAILVAVLLALGGGLLAGVFGSWRIGRLRPADALSKVG